MTTHATARVESVTTAQADGADGMPVKAYMVGNRVGESPAWHPAHACLYWIDVRRQELLSLAPGGHAVTRWALPDVVGAMALCEGDTAWLALRSRIVSMDLETGRLRDVGEVPGEREGNRLNDGKVSPTGRWFVFGSMDDRPQKQATGALYVAGSQGHIRLLLEGLVTCNGIAWSACGSQLFYSDSHRGLLMAGDWCEARGTLSNQRFLASLDEARGRPDGAAVDIHGDYWSAGVSAGCLNVLDADGALRRGIALPCRAPTMPAFAGTDQQSLFVTSLVRPQWGSVGACDGALLELRSPVKGLIPPLLGVSLPAACAPATLLPAHRQSSAPGLPGPGTGWPG